MFAELKIDFLELKSQIDGHRVGLTLGPKMHWIQITPFARKCLDRAMCLGCGLLITEARAFQAYEASTPRLTFYGYRDQEPIQFTQDHIVPKVKGGSNDPEWNIEVLCRTCNLIKGDSLAMRPALWLLKRQMQLREGPQKDLYLKVINLGIDWYGNYLYH